jgi:putative heme-binding domain-containing protein
VRVIPITKCSDDADHPVLATPGHRVREITLTLTLSRSTGRGRRAQPPARLHLVADTAAPVVNKPSPTTSPATRPSDVFKDKDGKPYPPLEQLAQRTGDPKAGERVFRGDAAGCIRCHQVNDDGGMIGPPLTTIGDKLTKPQLLESIFYPSAAIEMSYENWIVRTKDGDVQTGIKAEDTEDHVTLKDTLGNYHDIPADQIVSKRADTKSIMPEGLGTAMTQKELVDLIEYLSTLKNR